jgi:hypothetical protein
MNLKKEYGAKVMSLFSSSVTLIKVVIFPVGWFFLNFVHRHYTVVCYISATKPIGLKHIDA